MLAETGHEHRAVYATIRRIYRALTAQPPRA